MKCLMTDPHPDTPDASACNGCQKMFPFYQCTTMDRKPRFRQQLSVSTQDDSQEITQSMWPKGEVQCPQTPALWKNVSFTLCLNLTRDEVYTRVSLHGMVCVYSIHWAQVVWATYKLVTTKWQFIFNRILLHTCWERLWALVKASWGATCKKWNYHSAEDLVS